MNLCHLRMLEERRSTGEAFATSGERDACGIAPHPTKNDLPVMHFLRVSINSCEIRGVVNKLQRADDHLRAPHICITSKQLPTDSCDF